MNIIFILIIVLTIFLVIMVVAYMSALKKLTHCQIDYLELEQEYYDKELECATLTAEIEDMKEKYQIK